MRAPTLRRALLGLLEAGLVSSMLSGCITDDDPCTEVRHRTFRVAEPPPLALEKMVRACQSDAETCQALCNELLGRDQGHARSCEVEHHATEHVARVGYTYYTGGDRCPVPGRRPAGLCEATGREGSAIGGYLARAAWFEGASVHAFVQLARVLTEHGAPARLIRAMQRAALDEVRHATVMGALARAYGATPAQVEVCAPEQRSLEAIAIENASEGCVGETWAALVAMWQARHAGIPAVQAAFAEIAVDELRHAALSWELDAWLATRLPEDARQRVRAARERAIEELARTVEPADAELVRDLGLPDAGAARAMLDGARQALWAA